MARTSRFRFKRRTGYRASRSPIGRTRYARKTMAGGYKKRLKFATVGFARNVEKKYHDKTYISNSLEQLTGNTGAGVSGSNGATYISNNWGTYTFGNQIAGISPSQSNDMLKGLETGTTARTRIGNKMKVDYVKGAFTFTAAIVDQSIVPQNGEGLAVPVTDTYKANYLRTTYRFVIVKDMQVNSTATEVTWPMVFDTTGQQAGVHSELNVDNMGRFVVLEDRMFTLDADQPQKTCPFMVRGSNIGHVRYNGPAASALTDKGLYVIWAAFVMGYNGTATPISLPSPVGHSRLCFNDD